MKLPNLYAYLFKSHLSTFLVVTTCLSFLFFLWGINSWKYAFVGDEWDFYRYANKIASMTFYPFPFSFDGVFASHSRLVSIYQALFLNIFGQSNFSWRLSNIILIFPLSFFFYQWIKNSISKDVAILATLILQCSYYLANFFKIGYDNPQSLVLFIISLYLSNRFVKDPTARNGFWLGLTLGISFYIYIGPLFIFFLWPFFLPLREKINHHSVRSALYKAANTFLIILLPLFLRLPTLGHAVNSLGNSENFYIKSTVIRDLGLFYMNNDYFYNHFVVGPYFDILSALLCLIGTIFVLFHLKVKMYRYFFFSYISIVIVIGMTSPDNYSPTTRGIFFLPYGAAFAGMGLHYLISKIKNDNRALLGLGFLFYAIITLNVYKSQVGVFDNKSSGYTGMALLINAIQESKQNHKNIVIVLSPDMSINRYLWTLPSIIQAYGLQDVSLKITRPNDLRCSVQDENILYFQQDAEARKRIYSIGCYPSLIQRSIELKPKITVF